EQLRFGSEQQKLIIAASFAWTPSRMITLAQAGNASVAALETVLRRKGATLDVMGQTLAAVRARGTPEDRKLLADIAARRRQLSTLALRGAGKQSPTAYRKLLVALSDDVKSLEAELSESAQHALGTAPANLELIQKALRADEVLVETALYRPWHPDKHWSKQWGPARYVAWIVWAKGAPEMVALGEAKTIDMRVKRLRRSLRSDASDPEDAAQAMAESLAPILQRLSSAKRVVISPDSALHLVPWSMLAGDDGKPLIASKTLRLVTSGRDLLTPRVEASKKPALVLADPTYRFGTHNNTPLGRRSVDLRTMDFLPLAETRAEANAIALLLRKPTVLLGAAATERAVADHVAPPILHLSTHGFFVGKRRDVTLELPGRRSADNKAGALLENPLLKSGLALVGAADLKGSGNNDDGILTALEATALDLRGTQLVTLSACETGVGDTLNGAGIHGLLRAFRMAGAESIVASLWKVDDLATRTLMTRFYTELSRGTTREEALRAAQLAVRDNPETEHPTYWAAFQLTGAGGPMAHRLFR
ncbi:MAG: CHAT domain-containing protein, partial [Myxococcota bacterium]